MSTLLCSIYRLRHIYLTMEKAIDKEMLSTPLKSKKCFQEQYNIASAGSRWVRLSDPHIEWFMFGLQKDRFYLKIPILYIKWQLSEQATFISQPGGKKISCHTPRSTVQIL